MTLFNSPTVLTKELKIQQVATGRRIRLSTNFLDNFGFQAGTRLMAKRCTQGFDLVPTTSPTSPWKVHTRRYGHRRNNPTESIIDIQNNSFINQVIPEGVDRLHFTLMNQHILVRPVYAPLFNIRRSMRNVADVKAFLALSSGLDAIAFTNVGFNIQGVLDWRPQEARDKQDFTETGICTFLANHKPQYVFNEDLSTVDVKQLAKRLNANGPVSMLSIGLQCDDHSTAKSATLKRADIAQFKPSSRELAYYALKLIEAVVPATVFIENVPGWHGSEAQGILGAVLSRLGYHVQAKVINATDFGSLTSRTRCYLIASCWPGYEFPQPTGKNNIPLGTILQNDLPNFQDVSHTNTIAVAKTSGRDRFCPLDSCIAPTVLKSQSRRTKDSVYFTDNQGKILYPSLNALRILHGFNSALNLTTVGDEIATEQLGQGIDLELHTKVAEQLLKHITVNCTRNFN